MSTIQANPPEYLAMRWYVTTEVECPEAEGVRHLKFEYGSEKNYHSFQDAFSAYLESCKDVLFESGRSYSVKIMCHEIPPPSAALDKQGNLCEEEEEDFIDGPYAGRDTFFWTVYESTNCTAPDESSNRSEPVPVHPNTGHYVVKEEGKQSFDSVSECMTDFVDNATYDKFDISKDWFVAVECAKYWPILY